MVVAHDPRAILESVDYAAVVIGPVALPVEEHDDRTGALVDVMNPATIDPEFLVLERIDRIAVRGEAVEQPPAIVLRSLLSRRTAADEPRRRGAGAG